MSAFIWHFRSIFYILSAFLPVCLSAKPFVTAHLMGQFGNQLFIMAAAISLALDHGAVAIFPELTSTQVNPLFQIPLNYEKVFYHLDTSPLPSEIECLYRELHFSYDPIPYHPNMNLVGWFQSEKYFAHHKEDIINLFSPHPEILDYLNNRYSTIIQHPQTVSIHMRTYAVEPVADQQFAYINYGREYVEKAMALFPSDSLFVVFSNDMEWCKKELAGLSANLCFIEGEAHYYDFYLMSLCKHQIICNSTFSWWAAYLNRYPQKKVVAPPGWFSADYVRDTKDLIPTDWIILQE